MKAGVERRDLLQQARHQLAPAAHRCAGNVVDRLVGVELDALAAGVGQRVDHMSPNVQQSQFEHLEQADRAGADDDGVGLDEILSGPRRHG